MNASDTAPVNEFHPGDWASRARIQALVLMVATALGIYLCYRMALPFLSALIWSASLAVLFARFQRWLEVQVKPAGFAAGLSVVLIGLCVVIPATFVGQRILLEASRGAELLEARVKSGEWRHALDEHPRWAALADRIERRIDLPGAVRMLTTWLSTTAGSIVRGSVFQAIDFCLTLYLLFFFLRDGQKVLRALHQLSPLPVAETEVVLGRVSDTLHATVYGTLMVSVVQGLLGGLMFWWLGLPAPLLWGVVMGLLAVVPVLGAFVIWIPAAGFLALEGHWGQALILSLWGLLVVGTIDNLLAPLFVANRLKLHTVLAFLSVMGGLLLFGAAGFILGPIILTLTTALLEIWTRAASGGTTQGEGPDELGRFEGEGGRLAAGDV